MSQAKPNLQVERSASACGQKRRYFQIVRRGLIVSFPDFSLGYETSSVSWVRGHILEATPTLKMAGDNELKRASIYTMKRLKLSRFRNNNSIVLFALLFITASTVLRLVIQAEKLLTNRNSDRMEARVYSMTLPLYNHTLCSVPPCIEVLSANDSRKYNVCTKSATRRRGSLEQSACVFIPVSDRAPVPLVSFPGSGNTWVRGLLQQATGLCTGSSYCDRDLRSRGFPGEGLTSGSVLVVKTHRATPWEEGPHPSSKAVVIIRNPYDALVAERNRGILQQVNARKGSHVNSSHIQFVGKEYFGSNDTWTKFVLHKLKLWQDIVRYWVVEQGKRRAPSLVVKYEDLKKDTAAEISKVLTYLDMEKSVDDVRARLKDGYNTYKRGKHGNFTYFTQDQVINVNQIIREAQQLLHEQNHDQLSQHQININSYLRL